MDQKEMDRKSFELAWQFLLELNIAGITPELLDKYGRLTEFKERPVSIAGIYLRMLESQQNKGMLPNIIGEAINGINNLGQVLCDFQPAEVLKKYAADDWEMLLNDILFHLKPRGQIRTTPRSAWPQYCRAALSSARFFAQFSTHEDFYNWVEYFDRDERARIALPLLLDIEIHGCGFALACDFLKELGYVNFAKPDIHLRDIFVRLGLCQWNSSDYELFKAISRVARNVGGEVTPYYVDKIFWLIGSGNFYDDPLIGNKGKIGSQKNDFIPYAQGRLGVRNISSGD